MSVTCDLLANQLTGSIDLSKAIKLEEVAFLCESHPKWISMTLRTVKLNHRDNTVRRISLRVSDIFYVLDFHRPDTTGFRNNVGERVYQEWQELDDLLTHLWESRSIQLRVLHDVPSWVGGQCAKICIGQLLPEVTKKGIVELVEHSLGSEWQRIQEYWD